MFTIINHIFIFIWYPYDIENWYHYNMKFYIALRYRYNIIMMLEKRYHITMSLQSQYGIGLYCDVNPTKNRCRHNMECPLGRSEFFEKTLQCRELLLLWNEGWMLGLLCKSLNIFLTLKLLSKLLTTSLWPQ